MSLFSVQNREEDGSERRKNWPQSKVFLRSVKRDEEEEGGSVFLSMTFEPPFASSWLAAYLCVRGTLSKNPTEPSSLHT